MSAKTSSYIMDKLFSRGPMLFLHIALLTIGFIYIFPFLWMLGSALKTPGDFFEQGLTIFPAGEWQWSNFTRAWEGARFSRYFLNTVVTTLTATALSLLLASMAGYALSRLHIPRKRVIITLITVTFFLPRGYTILPVFEIVRGLGLLNTLSAVILVSTAGSLLFGTFLFYGYMRTIPSEIEEAAIMDGATVPQRYWMIVCPLAAPIFATFGLFQFMGNWNDFFTPLVFTLGKPELRTLAVGMFAFVGENSRDWTLMCAAAVISLLPVIIIYIFLQRYFIEGIAGAVKS